MTQQWANRPRFVFALQNMIVWGMGLPLGLAAWAGWALAGWALGTQWDKVEIVVGYLQWAVLVVGAILVLQFLRKRAGSRWSRAA